MWHTMMHRSVPKRMHVPRATLLIISTQSCFNKYMDTHALFISFHLSHLHCMTKTCKNIGVEVLVVAFRVCIWAAMAAWCLWVGTYDCKSSAFIPASIPAAIFCFCTEPSWLNGATLSLIGHGRIQRYSALLRATTPVCFLTALIMVEWYAKMMPAWMPKLWLQGGDTATPYISKVHVLDMTLWGLNTYPWFLNLGAGW